MFRSLFLSLCLCIPFLAHAQEVESPSSETAPSPKLPTIKAVARNVNFYKLAHPLPKTRSETEVIVFFWYGSPWAAKVDPFIREWISNGNVPTNVKITWAPVIFDEEGAFSARIFFALKMLDKETTISPILLKAVSEGRVDLQSPKSVSDFLSTQGVSFKDLQNAINNPLVIAQTTKVQSVMRLYDVETSPSYIIDGEYLIPSNVEQSPEKATAVMMFMTEKLSQGGPRP